MFSKSGLLKEGDKSLISLAKDITYKRVVGRIPNEGQRELYERGVKTGMLNSQVEANIMRKNLGALIGDANQAQADVFGRILDQNNFRKVTIFLLLYKIL